MKDNALYLEADEDITSAIDKLAKTPANSVQIVVPKRSTMLQSIINLKLLKKAAESNGKELVLVTNDRIASDLAGRVGLAVAPSLGAKAVVAEAEMPEDLKSHEEVIEADDPEPPPPPQPSKPSTAKRLLLRRKEVSAGPPAPPPPPEPEPDPSPTPAADAAPAKKSPKVPNFNKLQRRAIWVGLAVILVLGYAASMALMTTAKVTLYANGTKIDIDTNFTVDPNLKQTDKDKAVLAGQLVTVTKDLSGSFTPTGKKDVGTKASGTVTVRNCTTNPQPLVAGTRFAAPDGKIFRSSESVTVSPATFPVGQCVPVPKDIAVTADASGDSYNEAPANYTIPALGNPAVTAHGGQMSGGTTKIATVVIQADVDTARGELLAKDKENATRDLNGRVPSGYVSLESSTATSTSSVSPAPAVNAEGSSATLNMKVTYTVLAVKLSEYKELLQAMEQKQIGAQNQIYEDGLDGAQVTASEKEANGRQNFHLTTEAYGGAKLDTATIAGDIKGKRFGDAIDIANRLPGVSRAEISLWPGWANNLPNRTDKIKITIQVAGDKQ